MNNDYQRALDKKLEWLHWSKSREAYDSVKDLPLVTVWPMYQTILSRSDTYFMNEKFCDLVDLARLSVPDDLEWRSEWVPTPSGFMWFEKPFAVPELGDWAKQLPGLDKLRLSAVGWYTIPPGMTETLRFGQQVDRIVGHNHIQFAFFLDFSLYGKYGFNPWSYCAIAPGDKVSDRIKLFESGAYVTDGAYGKDWYITNKLHEIRWVFSAFHIMSQRLTIQVEHQANRHLRRRLEEAKTHNTAAIRYITLRRYEEAKKKAAETGHPVEWSCQWPVSGHWRNQWYAAEQVHRPVWIDDYIKGPDDKPLKHVEKIYRAVR